MVLLVIDSEGVPFLPLEGHAPRPVDVERVTDWRSLQAVEIEPRNAKVFQPERLVQGIESNEDSPVQPLIDGTRFVGLPEFGETLVPERSDDRPATVNL